MDFFRKNKTILLIVLPFVILVLFRATGTDHFRTDAKKLAEPSFSQKNIVTPDNAVRLEGEKLMINLGKDVIKHNISVALIKTIPPDSILNKNNIRMLRKHTGPVLLNSAETAVSVRIWMILSQMGFKNIYVLTEDPEPESLKYEFRPDTTARPE